MFSKTVSYISKAMKGDQQTAFIIKQMKNHCKNCNGVTRGVKAKKEKRINNTDMIRLAKPIRNKISLQNLGVSLKAIGLY